MAISPHFCKNTPIIFAVSNNNCTFAVPIFGEMLEWLKRHAWKACVPQKGIASSNLALSA